MNLENKTQEGIFRCPGVMGEWRVPEKKDEGGRAEEKKQILSRQETMKKSKSSRIPCALCFPFVGKGNTVEDGWQFCGRHPHHPLLLVSVPSGE